jgi:hypothetical protein
MLTRGGAGQTCRDAKLGENMKGVHVEVYINEVRAPISMVVQDNYRCTFHDGSLRPSAAETAGFAALLKPGRNDVRMQLMGSRALFDVQTCFYLWDSRDKVVVCDIDGTVTRSDLLGYSAHLLGYEYTHDGVTDVLTYLDEMGYKILFLTARPVTVADQTRKFLRAVGVTARDDGSQSVARLLGLHTSDTVLGLPDGALITTAERWVPAILIGLSPQGPAEFKSRVLREVAALFEREDAFAGGFGNRGTDAAAYLNAGIAEKRIFLIDEGSRVQMGKPVDWGAIPGRRFESYAALSTKLPDFFPPVDGSAPAPVRELPAATPVPAADAETVAMIEAAFALAGVGDGGDLAAAHSLRPSHASVPDGGRRRASGRAPRVARRRSAGDSSDSSLDSPSASPPRRPAPSPDAAASPSSASPTAAAASSLPILSVSSHLTEGSTASGAEAAAVGHRQNSGGSLKFANDEKAFPDGIPPGSLESNDGGSGGGGVESAVSPLAPLPPPAVLPRAATSAPLTQQPATTTSPVSVDHGAGAGSDDDWM